MKNKFYEDDKKYEITACIKIDPPATGLKKLANKYPDLEQMKPACYAIEVKNLQECPVCKYCGERTKKRDIGTKSVYDYNPKKERIERITITSQRYRCVKCKKTMTAPTDVDEITRTEEFERIIAYLAIKNNYSSEALSVKYGPSPRTISVIIHQYVSDMLLSFTPPEKCDALYLYPFMYQRKQRYYLAGTRTETDKKNGKENVIPLLICFFGHMDAPAELESYLTHQKNFVILNAESVILTDMNADIIMILKQNLDKPTVVIPLSLLKRTIDSFAADDGTLSSEDYRETVDMVRMLKRIVSDPKDAKMKNLKAWRDKVKKNSRIEPTLAKLVSLTTDYESEFLSSCHYCDNRNLFSEIEKKIRDFNSKNLSFDIMTAHMMFEEYGEYAITKATDVFQIDENYDPVLKTFYREGIHIEPLDKSKPVPKRNFDRNDTDGCFDILWMTLSPSKHSDEIHLEPPSLKIDGRLPFGPPEDEDA